MLSIRHQHESHSMIVVVLLLALFARCAKGSTEGLLTSVNIESTNHVASLECARNGVFCFNKLTFKEIREVKWRVYYRGSHIPQSAVFYPS